MKTKLSPLEIYQNACNRKSGCLFCRPVEGMPIEETKNFRVLIDTFPTIPGHLMISSKDHYGSAGEIPLEMQAELKDLKNKLKENIQGIFGSYIFYEHGRSGCCMSINPEGEKCEHFHLHCLPIDISIKTHLSSRFSCIEMHDYSDISPLFNEHGHYLFFEENSGAMYFFPAEDEKVESHLLRTLVCYANGVPARSNWQQYDEYEVFQKSYELVDELIYQGLEVFAQ